MSRQINDFPELMSLQNFISRNKVTSNVKPIGPLKNHLILMEFALRSHVYLIYVDDEYKDLHYYNPMLNCILILRELEAIRDSTDYLDWCKTLSVIAHNTSLLEYYLGICKHIDNISKSFESNMITSFVTDLDFQLNSGAIQLLRT